MHSTASPNLHPDETRFVEMVFPEQANHYGTLFGGHALHLMGKAAFIRFTDGAELLQIYIKSNEVDERLWSLFKLLDLGDFIGTEGKLFRTRTGELSIHAESITFLAKAMLPPPDKYYGLHDIEIRYRQRYADLIANRDVRRVFEKRSEIIRYIRNFFDRHGYIEVETPILTPLASGAAARPFVTHHNALDIDLYARIAPELYLKRLIVAGFEKVYEINRNFRNEGIDRTHSPEFTMLEFYEAYSEYEDLIRLTEELISGIVEQVCARTAIEYGEQKIDFARPWSRMTMREAIKRLANTDRTCKCGSALKNAIFTAPDIWPPATTKKLEAIIKKYGRQQ